MATKTRTAATKSKTPVAVEAPPPDEREAMTAQQTSALVTRAALQRALAQVDKQVPREARLEAGGYAVDLSLVIRGDITVDAVSESVSEPKPDVSDSQILCAILAGKTKAKVIDVVTAAMEQIRDARRVSNAKLSGEIKGLLDEAKQRLGETVEREAKRLKLMTEPKASVRAGAVKGAPRVHVEGSVGEHTVDLAVDVE